MSRAQFLCGRSHGGVRGGRSEVDKGLVLGAGPCARPYESGFVYIYTKRAAEGIAKCEHALALDRNLAYAHAYIGVGKIFIGRAEETESQIAEALRLSPRDTMAYVWMTFAGSGGRHLGVWEEAVAWFRRAIEANRNFPQPHFELAAALTQLGRLDDAPFRGQGWARAGPKFLYLPRPRLLYRREQ